MYDVIILGATFAAAGIARSCCGSALILESRPDAGYEFVSALDFGTGYEKQPVTQEGAALWKAFEEKGAFQGAQPCLFDCDTLLYQLLLGQTVLFNMHIVSVQKDESGFVCEAYGPSGLRTFYAKRIVDTRCMPQQCTAKTYNMLIDGGTGPDGHYVLRCPVSLDADYAQARAVAMKALEDLPEGHKLLLLADAFDYQICKAAVQETDGVICLPSKAYPNPILAYDAGICFWKEGVK